ncbi:hypothetical protein AB0876_32315 [Mycobacterium sp. NPDC049093]
MSIAPPPPAYPPTWPPQQYPPTPTTQRRRWPAVAAAAGAGAIVAGLITTVITLSVTAPATTDTTSSAAETVTVTAAPPTPPKALPAAQADAQTCHAWGTTDKLYTAAALAQSVIPEGMTITDPAVQGNPTWKNGVIRASELYGQAADSFESQLAPGTSPMLAQVSQTTVGSLRTLSESYKAFDPTTGNSVAVYKASQKAMDWLCR